MRIIKKNKLLFSVGMIYLLLLIFSTEDAVTSLRNSSYYLFEMLQVMPVVVIFTVLINAWIPKQTITKHLGEGSKLSGNLFALILGMISTGPIYAAFPIAGVLLKKGASIENIVIILSAWAVVKIPMLVNEVNFLGVKFMITRWILTVFSIWIIAKLTHLILRKDNAIEE